MTQNFADADASSAIQDIELVFGLVGPTGVDLTAVCDALESKLSEVSYATEIVSLSQLIAVFLKTKIRNNNEYERIKDLMTLGTKLREETKQVDIVGRLGIAQIRSIREKKTQDPLQPVPRVAYIVRSFKRPEEVELFRKVYGKAFTLLSVYAPRLSRIKRIERQFSTSTQTRERAEQLAIEIIKRDYSEEQNKEFGQNVSDTFPLADYFITSGSATEIDENIKRLVRLVFGDPYLSPSRDEQSMFFAQSAALRSLDLSRQVGAAIVNSDGDVLCTGCNEVPKSSGGLYWTGDEYCHRDYELGHDSNVTIKREMIEEMFCKLRAAKWLSPKMMKKTAIELTEESLTINEKPLKDAKLLDVIEFGRAVHAEMAAITQAAKNGVALAGSRLFCTTFPCHICARHILSSGISDVIFIEPYEKSRTGELYSDSISIEPSDHVSNKTVFRAFVGVAPRRYMDLFTLTTKRKNSKGEIISESEIGKQPKLKRSALTYLALEDMMINTTKHP